MEWFPASKDHLPLTWWKQTPVYLAAVIALAGVASMVFTSLLMAVNPAWIQPLVFSVNHLLGGWVWTPVTYVLVNPPSLFFLLTSYLLWSFGERIVRHLGRCSFVKLVMSLVLVSPLLLCILSLLGPQPRDWPAMGLGELEFGVFLAFAALYPTAQVSIIILTLEVRVLAIAIVAVDVLMCLAGHNWPGLFLLAGQVATAVGYIRYEQGRLQLPSFKLWSRRQSRSKPKLQVYNPEKRSSKPAVIEAQEPHADVDAILEKISRQGMASLSPQEKQALEKASERLGKKGR